MKLIKNGVWSKQHLEFAIEYIRTGNVIQSIIETAFGQKTDVCYDIFEFGCYDGNSLKLMNDLCNVNNISARFIGIDSFEGLPEEAKDIPKFYLFKKGFFDRGGVQCSEIWLDNVTIIKKWFSELNKEDVIKYGMKPASLVHIDSDLYISAYQALDFMFNNKLIMPGTLIAYDEFRSTGKLEEGGESRAHMEICDKYKVNCEEIFRNEYLDRITCWQSVFVVKDFITSNYGVQNVYIMSS